MQKYTHTHGNTHTHTDAHKDTDEYFIVAFCKNTTIIMDILNLETPLQVPPEGVLTKASIAKYLFMIYYQPMSYLMKSRSLPVKKVVSSPIILYLYIPGILASC